MSSILKKIHKLNKSLLKYRTDSYIYKLLIKTTTNKYNEFEKVGNYSTVTKQGELTTTWDILKNDNIIASATMEWVVKEMSIAFHESIAFKDMKDITSSFSRIYGKLIGIGILNDK